MFLTNQQQSRHLKALGLPENTADMILGRGKYKLPLWSTDKLLKMASKICVRLEIHLRIDGKWNFFAVIDEDNKRIIFNEYDGLEFKEGAYKLMVWILENEFTFNDEEFFKSRRNSWSKDYY